YFVVLIYMAVILAAGKKFMPAGAQALMDFAKGMAGTVVTRGLKPIGKSLKERTNPGVKERVNEKIAGSERIQKIAEGMAQTKTPKGWRKIASPAWAVTRGLGRTLGSKRTEEMKGAIAQAEGKAQKMDEKTVASQLKEDIPMGEKIGYLNSKIKSNDIDDVRTAYGKDFEEDVAGIYAEARKSGRHKDIESAFPNLIPKTDLKRSWMERRAKEIKKDSPISIEQAASQAATEFNNLVRNGKEEEELQKERTNRLKSIRPDRAKQISQSVLDTSIEENKKTIDAMITGWDGRQMGSFLSQHGQMGAKAISERLREITKGDISSDDNSAIEELIKKGIPRDKAGERIRQIKWLNDTDVTTGGNNPAMASYLQSTGAQGLL
ncbi:MAG: hypothetical protein Q8P74_01025, partial [bacterium]|nr:hypothetical protein [bacterium]